MSNPTPSNLLTTPSSLLSTLTSFITTYIHHLLYLRRLYPLTSFLSTRAYNHPVRQCRHPSVCAWILSAVNAVEDQMSKGTVRNVSVVVFGVEKNVVLERWVITIDDNWARWIGANGRLSAVGDIPFEERGEGMKINVADLEAQFRATLSRLSNACSRLKPLPANMECSFTVAIEVRDEADRPVGVLDREERKWVAAEPEPWASDGEEVRGQGGDQDGEGTKKTRAAGKTIPVRRLEAGELRMELWVEESDEKLALVS